MFTVPVLRCKENLNPREAVKYPQLCVHQPTQRYLSISRSDIHPKDCISVVAVSAEVCVSYYKLTVLVTAGDNTTLTASQQQFLNEMDFYCDEVKGHEMCLRLN